MRSWLNRSAVTGAPKRLAMAMSRARACGVTFVDSATAICPAASLATIPRSRSSKIRASAASESVSAGGVPKSSARIASLDTTAARSIRRCAISARMRLVLPEAGGPTRTTSPAGTRIGPRGARRGGVEAGVARAVGGFVRGVLRHGPILPGAVPARHGRHRLL